MAMATNDASGGAKKKAPIKVKQDMIDFIKTQGMTKALKRAGEIKASGKGGEAEFLEGVRRMYGANRLSAATKAATPPKFNAPAGANKKPAGRMSKSAAPAKKGGMSTGAKITGGVAAGALLLASRGKAAGLAAKLSPQLAKSGVGKALGMSAAKRASSASNVMAKKISSVKEAAGTKALSASGRAAAKAKRPVTQSQYDAMKAQAAKKGVKTPIKKKAGLVGAGTGSVSLKGDTAKKPVKKTTKK